MFICVQVYMYVGTYLCECSCMFTCTWVHFYMCVYLFRYVWVPVQADVWNHQLLFQLNSRRQCLWTKSRVHWSDSYLSPAFSGDLLSASGQMPLPPGICVNSEDPIFCPQTCKASTLTTEKSLKFGSIIIYVYLSSRTKYFCSKYWCLWVTIALTLHQRLPSQKTETITENQSVKMQSWW